jgi:hypothetical protein
MNLSVFSSFSVTSCSGFSCSLFDIRGAFDGECECAADRYYMASLPAVWAPAGFQSMAGSKVRRERIISTCCEGRVRDVEIWDSDVRVVVNAV